MEVSRRSAMTASLFRYLFLSIMFFGAQGFAEEPEALDGPIHEAFVTPVYGAVIYEAVAQEPPSRITEKIPPAPGDQEEWIPGYWAWSQKKGDYVWVCGVWRKPPPGLIWNPGYWTQLDEGWVWIPGFWHSQPAQNLAYIRKAPPATINENVGNPPSDNMFWAAGFWDYSRSRNSFQWRPGRWESLDPNWVFTPAGYTWRPDGYLFIPSYWDWPLESRGAAYCTILLDSSQSGIVHTPTVILEPEVIIRTLFPCWPDYVIFFHHWGFYHPGFWDGWCCVPPWWGWGGGWWWFDWYFAWDLWWWWGHPGFPYPWWLAAALAGIIPPPGAGIFPLMADVNPPPIVGPKNMLPPDDLIEALGDRPVLPADPERRADIVDQVTPPPSENEDLRPEGTPGEKPPEPPAVEQDDVDQGPRQYLPPIPETPAYRPPIRPVQPAQPSPRPFTPRPSYPRPEVERPQTPRPFYPPRDQRPRPRWPRPERTPPQQTPRWPRPEYEPPQQTPRWPRPEYEPPQQTPSVPETETRPPSFQTPQFRPPQQTTPMIRPEYRPMRPEFKPPTQTPQSTPETELY